MHALTSTSRPSRLLTSCKLIQVTVLAFTVAGASVWIASAAKWQAASSLAQEPHAAPSLANGAELSAWRNELLDLAFRAASAMPIKPHVKNRARAQESVVDALLELDQPKQALADIEHIDNWRRGAAYADLAFHLAHEGKSGDVQHYLDLAEGIAARSEKEGAQDWQRDRIRLKIARTHVVLGHADAAARSTAGAGEAEVGKLAAVEALVGGADVFDTRIAALDAAATNGDFDRTQNALEACAELFGRVYDDSGKRQILEEKIKSSWNKLPVQIRIGLLLDMSGQALDHDDPSTARRLVDDAQAIVDGAKWLPEDQIPVMARIAAIRHRAGQVHEARAQADAALALFDAQRQRILDIYRAGALRPLAEAYQTLGDPKAALAICKRAVEEGTGNPNSRPRAEDLCATCISMAVHGIEPDTELVERMKQIAGALGDPW